MAAFIEVGIKVGDQVLVTIPRYCEKQSGTLVHIFPKFIVPFGPDVDKYYGEFTNRKSRSAIALDRYVVEISEGHYLIVPLSRGMIIEKEGGRT